jgi:predicted transcriptional regulator
MTLYILLAVVSVDILVFRYIFQKKASELKQNLYNEVNASQEPITAGELAEKLNAGDGMVYHLLDELVDEKKIGVIHTQKIIQGRRVRVRHYQSIVGTSIRS